MRSTRAVSGAYGSVFEIHYSCDLETFRNLIFHEIIENLPREQFITRDNKDKQIAERFLSEHVEVLLKRRSKSQNTIEWVSKPLYDAFTIVLELDGCNIQDDRGKFLEEKLITYLVTLAKCWTTRRLIQRPLYRQDWSDFNDESVVSTAIVIGNIKTVRKLFQSRYFDTFFRQTLRSMNQYEYNKDLHEHIVDPMHPILAAIFTGKMEILQFFLQELLSFSDDLYDLYWEDKSHPVYFILRIIIETTNTHAITLAYDMLIGYMCDCYETKSFSLITLAAKTGDITTFRTVIHLYADQFKDSVTSSKYGRTCREAHEDMIWSILKRALLRPSAVRSRHYAPPKDDIKCLIGFIMTHYDKILMETAFSSPETLVPVWKNKAPSKQDLVDRSPLLIEQAMTIAGSQPVSKTTYCETISKKEDHALLACGASKPPKY